MKDISTVRRWATALVLALALGGCATAERCTDRTFYRAYVAGQPNPNRYLPGVAELKINDDLTLRASLCEDEPVQALCVDIHPAQGATFQFVGPQLKVRNEAGAPGTDLALEKIVYRISCHGTTGKDITCDSPTGSPRADGVVVHPNRLRTVIAGAAFWLDAYELPADVEFSGATVSAGFMSFPRKYTARTEPFPSPPGDQLLVAMPPVRVRGRTMDVPDVTFRRVTENVCHPGRPLSLQ